MNRHEEKRFWEKVIKGSGPSACWIWVGAIGDDGYGRFWTQAENMAEREHRGRGNLHNPLWRHQGRAARAAAARLLRAHTIQNGYEQQKIDELIRGIIMPGQQPLF